jgi:fluoride exporter
MIIYLLIALGGALGSVARHGLSATVETRLNGLFPWGTFIVNVSGCVLIGLFAALPAAGGRPMPPTEARAFLMIGLCGGYTTFSAFSLQTLNLIRLGDWPRAGAYVVASVVLCILGVWLGQLLGTALAPAR